MAGNFHGGQVKFDKYQPGWQAFFLSKSQADHWLVPEKSKDPALILEGTYLMFLVKTEQLFYDQMFGPSDTILTTLKEKDHRFHLWANTHLLHSKFTYETNHISSLKHILIRIWSKSGHYWVEFLGCIAELLQCWCHKKVWNFTVHVPTRLNLTKFLRMFTLWTFTPLHKTHLLLWCLTNGGRITTYKNVKKKRKKKQRKYHAN